MLRRCYDTEFDHFKDYGGRGIKVCKRWHKFENFYADMGEPPTPKHTLERKNNDKGYSPSNCKWATRKEQSNNTRWNQRITISKQTKNLCQWLRFFHIVSATYYYRLRKGMDKISALTTPKSNIKAV